MNFSTFLVIGKTSPVTYQVLGHLKTCLVLGFGYTLLHDPFTERNIIGILIAILGMGLYSYFCTHENKKKQLGDLSTVSQVYIHISDIHSFFNGVSIGTDGTLVWCVGFQIKDRETAPLLAGKNMGYEDKESHEVKKATKDSLVWVMPRALIVIKISCIQILLSVNHSHSLNNKLLLPFPFIQFFHLSPLCHIPVIFSLRFPKTVLLHIFQNKNMFKSTFCVFKYFLKHNFYYNFFK